MGLYDRDYVRHEPQGSFFGRERSMVANLVLLNVGVFLAMLLLGDQFFGQRISSTLGLHADLFTHPWNAWQLFSYGFIHDPGDPQHVRLASFTHVGFNMLTLWFLGRDVEGIYGRKEFLRIYISILVLSGLAWVVVQNVRTLISPDVAGGYVIGASGAVTGIMVLYALHYPRRMLLVWGILPVPAMVLCVLYVLADLYAFGQGSGAGAHRVSYESHLAGALFAFLYFRLGWNWGRLLPGKFSGRLRWPLGPRLKIHKDSRYSEQDLNKRVDEILAKISHSGEASLTREERKLLEDASRRYQQRRS